MGKKSPIPDLSLVNHSRGKRYVFFDTLKHDLPLVYQNAENIINEVSKSLIPEKDTNNGQRMKDALTFLKQSAAFEREKELRFFQHFNSSHPEIQQTFKNINLSDIVNDYAGFIIKLNQLIKGAHTFKQLVQAELKRIDTNNREDKNKYKNIQNLTKKQQQQYEDDLRERRKEKLYLTTKGDTIFRNIFYSQSEAWHKFAVNLIIQYGAELFTFKSGKLSLAPHQLSALIALLGMKANEIFLTQIQQETPNITFGESIDIILQDPYFQRTVNNLLHSPNIFSALDSVAAQFNLNFDANKKIQKSEQKVKDLEQELFSLVQNNTQNKYSTAKDWMSATGITHDKLLGMFRSIQPISAQLYYTSEDLSLVDLITNYISGVLGGGVNPTDDIEAGALITNLEYDSNALATIEKNLWDIQEQHFKKVRATSTLQDFNDNIQELLQARQEQEQYLKEALKEVDEGLKGPNELLKHINIHSTVKAYSSAGSDVFKSRGGFGGAAFGSNLINELGILSSVITEAGLPFSQDDQENFLIAMINAGEQMIGRRLRHTIEDYFSAFVGLLMFNDAAIAANDIKNWANNNFTSNNSIEDLHLYQLNGIIVPSSYLLEKTYEALSPLPDEITSNTRGISVTLKTYNKGPINHDWDYTAATAISVTKLERMHFLAGFADFLDELNQRMNTLT